MAKSLLIRSQLLVTMLVSICAITYKRPQGLKRLLEGINQLTFNNFTQPNIEVIVIDNDREDSALAVIDEVKESFRWQLKFDREPERGISYARNRALATANPETNFIATIDDDEVPAKDWLEKLLAVQKQYSADVVTGPVIPYFDHKNVPIWIEEGRFFEHTRHQTGSTRHVAFTNNVLIRAEIIRKDNLRFDKRFAIAGGEDVYFFMSLHRKGYQIIWADDALVYVWIPATRINAKWILQRGYSTYGIHSFVEKELYSSFGTQASRFFKATGLIVIGLLKLFPALVRGQQEIIAALLSIYRGSGSLAGLNGLLYQQYKTVHSDSGISQ
jgi:glycosyltransferase involved in cell wall biosynthesis